MEIKTIIYIILLSKENNTWDPVGVQDRCSRENFTEKITGYVLFVTNNQMITACRLKLQSLRCFQSEDEDEALAKALENSQMDDPSSAVCHQSQGYGYDSRQPSQTNLVT